MGTTGSKLRRLARAVRRVGRRCRSSPESPCMCMANRRATRGYYTPSSTGSEWSMNGNYLTAKDAPDNLECPICYHYMTKPIFTCENGHSVCGDCKHRMNNCPFCVTVPLRYRDFTAEAWACRYRFPCRYEAIGCNEKIMGRKLRAHMAKCDFRHMTCSMCDGIFPSALFWFHLEHDHSLMSNSHNEGTTRYYIHVVDFSKNEFRWCLRWFTCFQTNFLCHFEKRKETWCFWISVEGNCEKFSCSISFFNEKKGSQIKYEGPVNHMRAGLQDVISAGNGLILNVEQLHLFLKESKFADVTFGVFIPEEGQQKQARTRIATYRGPQLLPTGPAVANTSVQAAQPVTRNETIENIRARISLEQRRRRLQRGVRVRRHSCPDAEIRFFSMN